MKRLLPLLALLCLLGVSPARAAGPTLLIGAAEDDVKQATLADASAKMQLLRLAGFQAVRITSIWAPGLTSPTAAEQTRLANVAAAAKLTGMQVYVVVMNLGSQTTPLSDAQQADFAAYAAALVRRNRSFANVIVGNEPNLNRFWLPQYGTAGENVAAPAYESLLAKTYDALKAVDRKITVIGGAVSPRGVDKPNTGRDTHSPTTFIADLGSAYRASGRTTPIMDALAIHPYEDNSSLAPTFQHPNSSTIAIADYGKLVSILGKAFDGTAQPGSTLPIVYGEFGVESQIPAEKSALYTGTEPTTTKPVDETTQGLYYRQAVALAFCQPTVQAIFIFHAFDEASLDRWQSGVYYADDTPKSSLQEVQRAIRDSQGGIIARCPGLALTPHAKVSYPRGAALATVPLAVTLTCDVDCNYRVRLEKLPRHSTTLGVSGHAAARIPT
ncbi:MAG: hypothetical protein C5B48_01430, partial [Candidatus Rokuibacteriota bacterium]